MISVKLFSTIFDSKAKKVTFTVTDKMGYNRDKKIFRDIKKIKEIRSPKIRRFVMTDIEGSKKTFIAEWNNNLVVTIE